MTESGDTGRPAQDWAAPRAAAAPGAAHDRASSRPDLGAFAPPDPASAAGPPAACALPAPVASVAPPAPTPPYLLAPAPGYGQSWSAQQGFAPPGYGQQGYVYPGYGHPGYGQPAPGLTGYGWTGPGQHAAVPATGPAAGSRGSGRVTALILGSLAAVTAVVVGLAVVLPRVLPGADGQRAAAAGQRPVAGTGAGSREVTDPAIRTAAIDRVLAARGAAVTTDDAAAWKRTQIGNATAPAFARLAALPISVWRYDIASVDAASTAADVILVVRVHTRYDVDTADAIVREKLTMRHGAGGWQVATETNATARLQPWDLGTLTFVRGKRSLVIGIDQRAAVLRRYAAVADSVTPDVTAVWGIDWNQRPVLIVPRTVGQLGRALEETEKFLTDFAAVTTGESGSAAPDKTAFRVWTNTPGLSDVGGLGREIVLRHEITHVATAAPDTPGVPLWLEEGFAEYVGYSTTSVPERTAWSELVTAVRAGKAPAALPDTDAFHAGAIDLAYESSDLACRLIATRYGQAGLVRLYRLVRDGTGSEDENLDAALKAVTGLGTAAFVISWRARMDQLA